VRVLLAIAAEPREKIMRARHYRGAKNQRCSTQRRITPARNRPPLITGPERAICAAAEMAREIQPAEQLLAVQPRGAVKGSRRVCILFLRGRPGSGESR
jgi:hypothetical protein